MLAPGTRYQYAVAARDVQACHAVHCGAAEVIGPSGALGAARGADDVEVAPGGGDKLAARRDAAAYVVQVFFGFDADRVAADAPAQVVHVLCIEADHLASGNGAAVGEVAA